MRTRPRLGDKREVLLGKPENRYLREIDLLVARQREKDVERPLVAVQIDDKGLIAGRARGPVVGFEGLGDRHFGS